MLAALLNRETLIVVAVVIAVNVALTLLLRRLAKVGSIMIIFMAGLTIPVLLMLLGAWVITWPNPKHSDVKGMAFVADMMLIMIAAPIGLATAGITLLVRNRMVPGRDADR